MCVFTAVERFAHKFSWQNRQNVPQCCRSITKSDVDTNLHSSFQTKSSFQILRFPVDPASHSGTMRWRPHRGHRRGALHRCRRSRRELRVQILTGVAQTLLDVWQLRCWAPGQGTALPTIYGPVHGREGCVGIGVRSVAVAPSVTTPGYTLVLDEDLLQPIKYVTSTVHKS